MEKNVEKINRLRRFLVHIHGNEIGNKRFTSLMRASGSLKVLQFKYGKIDGQIKYDDIIEKCKIKNTLVGYIARYGEDLGTTKYYEKNKKLSVGADSLRARGYSEDEIVRIKNNHATKSKTDKASMIIKYGEKIGNERYAKKLANFKTCWNYEHIMKTRGVDEGEAKKIVSDYQRRGLPFYINKYGLELGTEKYVAANKKRVYANTKNYYIEQYGNELGVQMYKYVISARTSHLKLDFYLKKFGDTEGKKLYTEMLQKKVQYFPNFSSNIECQFNQCIYDKLPIELQLKFYGAPITKPFFINVDREKYNTVCIVPDIKLKNIIIEFDGDYWHSTPLAIERDLLKNRIYEDCGYFVIRIKESEYLNNPEVIINNVLTLIRNNIK